MLRARRMLGCACLAVLMSAAMAGFAQGGHADTLDAEELQDFLHDTDRTMVVSVLAAWCGPCREEVPALNALHKEYRERGVEVVGISLDFSEQALEQMLVNSKVRFPVYWAGEEAMETLGVTEIPLLIFVRNGEEVERVVGLHGLEGLRPHFENLADH